MPVLSRAVHFWAPLNQTGPGQKVSCSLGAWVIASGGCVLRETNLTRQSACSFNIRQDSADSWRTRKCQALNANRDWPDAPIAFDQFETSQCCKTDPRIGGLCLCLPIRLADPFSRASGGALMSQNVSQISEKQNGAGDPLSFRMPGPLERMLKASIQTAEPGQYLLMETDETSSVLCVLTGWLSLSKSLTDGETQIVDFALPGEIIETGSADGSVSAVSIEALTDASVAVVPILAWENMKRQRPDLAGISSDIRAAARARTAGRMLRLGRGRAAMRLAYALLELNIRLEAIGQSRDGKFHIPMNQRVLGDFVGLTSVHVCRTLGQMVSDGIIRANGRMNIEILKLDVLAEMAGADSKTLRSEILAQADCTASTLAYPAYA